MFHLRISITEAQAGELFAATPNVAIRSSKIVIDSMISKFKPNKYVFSYEYKLNNHHIHAHLEYPEAPKKSTISDFFKKNGYCGLYYHKPVVTTEQQNLLYCVKELQIITDNLSAQERDKLINETIRINEDKATDQRDKLYNLFMERLFDDALRTWQIYERYYEKGRDYEAHAPRKPYPFSLGWVSHWISEVYVKEYKKAPPLCHLNEYVLYIAHKVNAHPEINYDVFNLENFYCRRFGELKYDLC